MMKILFVVIAVATCVQGAAPTAATVAVNEYATLKTPTEMTITVTPATKLVTGKVITVVFDKAVFAADAAATVKSTKVADVTTDTCKATGVVSNTKKTLKLTLADATTCDGPVGKVMTIIVSSNLGANPAAGTVTAQVQTTDDNTDKAATYVVQAAIGNCKTMTKAEAKCTTCDGGYALKVDKTGCDKFTTTASTNCKTAKAWSTATAMNNECSVCKDGFKLNADKVACDACGTNIATCSATKACITAATNSKCKADNSAVECATANVATCSATKVCLTSKAGFACSTDGAKVAACKTGAATCDAAKECLTASKGYKCVADKVVADATTVAPTTAAPTSAPSSAAAFGSSIAVAITFMALLN